MIIFFLVFVFFEIAKVQAGCKTELYFSQDVPIYLQPVGDNKIISLDESFVVPNGGEVYVYCKNGLSGESNQPYVEWERRYETTEENKLAPRLFRLKCENNRLLRYSSSIDLGQYPYTCPTDSVASMHAIKLDSCEHQGLFYGIEIANNVLVFAELCYDISNSELMYIHYKSAKRHMLLKNQSDFYPSQDVKYYIRDDNKISLAEVNYKEDFLIEVQDVPILPYFRNIINKIAFEFGQLVPPVAYAGPLSKLIGSINSTNAVPWWTPLKYGNWESYQHLLLKESKKTNFDVYAGTSHIAKYPDELMFENDVPITINVTKIERQIPLYIWNYVKSENGLQEFVIIGVNSPLVETNLNSSVILCEDICDNFKFLTPLEGTRKLPYFGYMFCCKPDDVREILSGFPNLKTSFTPKPPLVWD